VGPRARLVAVVNLKFSSPPLWESKPDRPTRNQSIPTKLSRLINNNNNNNNKNNLLNGHLHKITTQFMIVHKVVCNELRFFSCLYSFLS
jgi:hypothetical protein